MPTGAKCSLGLLRSAGTQAMAQCQPRFRDHQSDRAVDRRLRVLSFPCRRLPSAADAAALCSDIANQWRVHVTDAPECEEGERTETHAEVSERWNQRLLDPEGPDG